jgi:hypothetical protein
MVSDVAANFERKSRTPSLAPVCTHTTPARAVPRVLPEVSQGRAALLTEVIAAIRRAALTIEPLATRKRAHDHPLASIPLVDRPLRADRAEPSEPERPVDEILGASAANRGAVVRRPDCAFHLAAATTAQMQPTHLLTVTALYRQSTIQGYSIALPLPASNEMPANMGIRSKTTIGVTQ